MKEKLSYLAEDELKKQTVRRIKNVSLDDIVAEQYEGTEFEQYFKDRKEKNSTSNIKTHTDKTDMSAKF